MILPKPSIKKGEMFDAKGKKIFYLKVIPVNGVWTYFEINERANIWVRIDASKRISFDEFLNIFEKKKKVDLKEIFKTILPYETDLEKCEKKIRDMYSKEKYSLSKSVRIELNTAIYPKETQEMWLKKEVLTKKDVLSIRNYLMKMNMLNR